jgi:glycerol kinase
MQDLHNNIGFVQSIRSQVVTAAVNGSSADLQNFNSAEFMIDLGTFAGTTPTATIKLQESEDNVTFTDISTEDILGGALPVIDTTNDESVHKRGYLGNKRYVRGIVSATTGTGPSLPMSITVVKGHARKYPIS